MVSFSHLSVTVIRTSLGFTICIIVQDVVIAIRIKGGRYLLVTKSDGNQIVGDLIQPDFVTEQHDIGVPVIQRTTLSHLHVTIVISLHGFSLFATTTVSIGFFMVVMR